MSRPRPAVVRPQRLAFAIAALLPFGTASAQTADAAQRIAGAANRFLSSLDTAQRLRALIAAKRKAILDKLVDLVPGDLFELFDGNQIAVGQRFENAAGDLSRGLRNLAAVSSHRVLNAERHVVWCPEHTGLGLQ